MECIKQCVASEGWWTLLAPLLAVAGYWITSRLAAAVPPEWTYTTRSGAVIPVGLFWHRAFGNGPLAAKAIAAAPATPAEPKP
jgi:hypothetical protein